MAIKPILFNTEMVRAIQDGRKDTTRRLVKRNDRGGLIKPYAVGDVLWVRETWDFLPCITCMERGCTLKPAVYEDTEAITEGCWIYRADSSNTLIMNCHNWRPSIHMPKAAARIFLHVTSIFAVDLQGSINKAWCPALELQGEGIDIGDDCRSCIETYGNPACISESGDPPDDDECGLLDDPRGEFAELWDSTIQKGRLNREGWAADPWVWVIRFERCERPEGWPE